VVEPRVPIVAVDFDLTLVDDDEKVLPGARDALVYLKKTGWKVIIWTTRNDTDHVKAILTGGGVPFDHINENPETDIGNPPRKVYFDATVDDKAVPFQGDWGVVVAELDRKRASWRLAGETKNLVKIMAAGKDGERIVGAFTVRDGRVVEMLGSDNPFVRAVMSTGLETEDGVVFKPDDGVHFLKALSEVRGTYLWAETN
jgi:hypothetical protein